jgi:hypothetical protein
MQKHIPFINLNPIKYDVYLNLPIPLENWDVYSLQKSNYSYNENSGIRGLMEHTASDEYYGKVGLTERQVYFSNRKRHYAAIKIQREYRRTHAKDDYSIQPEFSLKTKLHFVYAVFARFIKTLPQSLLGLFLSKSLK